MDDFNLTYFDHNFTYFPNSSHITYQELQETFFSQTRKVCFFTTMVAILIGLVGNSLILSVFSYSKFRTNSSHVYMICSAISDNLFLIVHIFEDILRSYKETFLKFDNSLVNLLNITDMSNVTCQTVNYLRNVLRFTSAYIVIILTVQRLHIVSKPLSSRFKSRKSAWQTTLIIVAIALILNVWVPFIFSVKKMKNKKGINDQYCDIDNEYTSMYFIINLFYIVVIMMLPMIILIVCNILIIIQMVKSDLNRKNLQQKKDTFRENIEMTTVKKSSFSNYVDINERSSKVYLDVQNSSRNRQSSSKVLSNSSQNSMLKVKPHYWTVEQLARRRKSSKLKSSKNLTLTLLFISFSFIILNLPYFFGWLMFFYQVVFNKLDSVDKNYLFAFLQISENLYVLSYGSKFFIFYVSGEFFRNKLHLILGKKNKHELGRARVTFYTEKYTLRN